LKTIEIIVSPQGETTVETKGFAGSECFDASRFVEQALGKQIQQRKTAEFFAASENIAQTQTGQE
jgi:hypothetical protein